ncbi:expressed unknown protein [Seminavis robusta]|uniref:LRRK2 ARM repeat domain-containing protein n=1 Tax=Seminavis robusta TaxID=568900 RepID=A0A9N8EJ33_9STRA|nr:expressed unknown protein [Seminavis robusta]|eukprot:Sro1221_g253620.1 n/a (270) ;mRNA; r:3069-3878
MQPSSNKRRRKSNRKHTSNDADPKPDETTSQGAGVHAPATIVPELAEIPQIVMEEMMKTSPRQVAQAMDGRNDLLDNSNNNSEKHIKEAFRFGAHTMVLAQMRRWSANEDVQMCGCFCIEKLAYMDEREPQVIDAGAVEVVLSAMHKFPSSVGVQYGGCLALKNLLSGDSSSSQSTQTISARFVQQLGGVLVVKHAMEANFEDTEIQSVCCDILRFLALKKQFLTAMLEAGVGGIVMKTLEHHWKKDKGVKRVRRHIAWKVCSRRLGDR